MIKRIVLGAWAAVVDTVIFGPTSTLVGWKLGGTVATGYVFHLAPGAGSVADGMEIVSERAGGVGGTDQTRPPTKRGWG